MSDFDGVDWQTATYSDPEFVPGDPYEVALLGKRMKDTAKLIEQQAKQLHNLVDGEGWDSDAGREFQKKVQETVDLLGKSHRRYAAVATALGTKVGHSTKEWASVLHQAQLDAKAEIRKAREADCHSKQCQQHLDHLPKHHHDAKHLHHQKGQADGDLDAAKKKLKAILHHRDGKAGDVATVIHHAIDHDGLKDPKHHWWDPLASVGHDIVQWAKQIGHWAGVAAAVLGVLALVLSWVPVLGEVLGALALVASVLALVCDTINAAFGDGSWLDVGIDAVGVLSFGAGRLLGTTVKEAALAARGSRLITEASALSKAAGGMDKAFDLVSRIFGEGMSREKALEAMADGPMRLLPRFREVVSNSLNPKLYLNDIKDAAKGWPGLKSAIDPSRALAGAKELGALRGIAGTKFKAMAYGAKGLYFGSQTLPLAAGWANLGPSYSGEGPVTAPDIIGGSLHLKDIPGVGAGGVPFTHLWHWTAKETG